MQHRTRKTFAAEIFLLAAVVIVLLIASPLAAADEIAEDSTRWLLPIVEDDETMEKRIAAYMLKVHEIEAEYHFADENDLVLKYMFSSDENAFPSIPLFVDTEQSNSMTQAGETTERRVSLSAYYVLPEEMKTPEKRVKLLELVNQWHLGKWEPQRLYIDADGDLAMQCTINVPGKDFEVHAEVIADQIFRMYGAWGEIYQAVNEVATGEAHASLVSI